VQVRHAARAAWIVDKPETLHAVAAPRAMGGGAAPWAPRPRATLALAARAATPRRNAALQRRAATPRCNAHEARTGHAPLSDRAA
jgi:hypothetical protein